MVNVDKSNVWLEGIINKYTQSATFQLKVEGNYPNIIILDKKEFSLKDLSVENPFGLNDIFKELNTKLISNTAQLSSEPPIISDDIEINGSYEKVFDKFKNMLDYYKQNKDKLNETLTFLTEIISFMDDNKNVWEINDKWYTLYNNYTEQFEKYTVLNEKIKNIIKAFIEYFINTEDVYKVIYEKADIKATISELFERPLKKEFQTAC